LCFLIEDSVSDLDNQKVLGDEDLSELVLLLFFFKLHLTVILKHKQEALVFLIIDQLGEVTFYFLVARLRIVLDVLHALLRSCPVHNEHFEVNVMCLLLVIYRLCSCGFEVIFCPPENE